jgi:hypothetical protein
MRFQRPLMAHWRGARRSCPLAVRGSKARILSNRRRESACSLSSSAGRGMSPPIKSRLDPPPLFSGELAPLLGRFLCQSKRPQSRGLFALSLSRSLALTFDLTDIRICPVTRLERPLGQRAGLPWTGGQRFLLFVTMSRFLLCRCIAETSCRARQNDLGQRGAKSHFAETSPRRVACSAGSLKLMRAVNQMGATAQPEAREKPKERSNCRG